MVTEPPAAALFATLEMTRVEKSEVTIALLHRLWAIEETGAPDPESTRTVRAMLGRLMGCRPEEVPSR